MRTPYHSAWASYEAHPDKFLAYGVTSERDTGGSLETLCALADRGDISADAVPRYFFSGEIYERAQPTWGDAFLQIYPPEEAATAVGADDHLGSLVSGKLADILLLDADPLDKIRNTQATWRVVKGGWVYDPKALRPAAK